MNWSDLKKGSILLSKPDAMYAGVYLVLRTGRRHGEIDWLRLDTGDYLPADPEFPDDGDHDIDDVQWEVLL